MDKNPALIIKKYTILDELVVNIKKKKMLNGHPEMKRNYEIKIQ